MNKIADYFGVHYTAVSLTIERLAEECMIARLRILIPLLRYTQSTVARLDDIAKTLGLEPGGQIGAPIVLFITPDGILGPNYSEPA